MSTTVGGMDLDALLAGIRGAESGGANAPDTATTGYTAIGPATPYGNALGAYQFLPSTMQEELAKINPSLGSTTPAQFLASRTLQNEAAAQYIKDGVAKGATSPVQIGEFWLGGGGGLASPVGSTDGSVTPLQHGLDVLKGYSAALGQTPLDAGASSLANALGNASSVDGEDSQGSSDNESAKKQQQDADFKKSIADPLGFGALTAWLTTASHNLPLYILAFVLVLGGFLWLAQSSGAVDKAVSLAKVAAV